MPMQYASMFKAEKNDYFRLNNKVFFVFAKNKICGYTLEPPQRGGSNEEPRSVL